MSLIPCTSSCVYQEEGCCTLERAASCGTPADRGGSGCVHYIAAGSAHDGPQRVPDRPDHGQL